MSGDFLLQTLLEYDITVSTCSIWGKNIDQNELIHATQEIKQTKE